jgi:hypothetical protein
MEGMKGSWDADTILFLSHGTNENNLFINIDAKRGDESITFL